MSILFLDIKEKEEKKKNFSAQSTDFLQICFRLIYLLVCLFNFFFCIWALNK